MHHSPHLPFTLLLSCALGACAPASLTLPTKPPVPQPSAFATVEGNGAIFRAGSSMLLFEDLSAYRVGDVLTVEIAESMSSSTKQDIKSSSESSVKSTGSGATDDMSSLLKTLFNLDLSNSTTSKTNSKDEITSSQALNGNITVSVIDSRPNGLLTVAGEKRIRSGGTQSTLRFSGLVNRRDIRQGNVVSSKKVADARIERIGEGVVSDPGTLNWLSRLFLSVMDI